MNTTRTLAISLATVLGLTACARPASAETSADADPDPVAIAQPVDDRLALQPSTSTTDGGRPADERTTDDQDGREPLDLHVAGPRVDPDPDPDPDPTTVPEIVAPSTDDSEPTVQVPDLDLTAPVLADCGPQGGLPGGAASVESIVLDVDDDGIADEVTTYFVALGDSAGWRLRSELGNGVTDDVAIVGVGAGVARILGGVHADFDITDPSTHDHELLVQVGANASGVDTAVYGLDDDGCLLRFAAEGGSELVLPVHQSIGTTSGVYCESFEGAEFLTRLESTLIAGTTYAATATRLTRVGDELHESPFGEFEIDAVAQAGWFGQYGTVSCPFEF